MKKLVLPKNYHSFSIPPHEEIDTEMPVECRCILECVVFAGVVVVSC
jgi:hypothetical protein